MASFGVSFSPPPYPYERLDALRKSAASFHGGAVDCSIGSPVDPPPSFLREELARAHGARGYPSSAGSLEYRSAAARWLNRRFQVDVGEMDVAACVGTKEFVASLAGYAHLRLPERDVVLYPSVSYPTYAMSAALCGLRAVPVTVTNGRLDLDAVAPSDVSRALVLWSNSPSNPTGHLDDLAAAADWGRRHGVLVASDECYVDFTWAAPPRSILQRGATGVLAVHSVSKRSNLAGVRAGFYAGDPSWVSYLRSVRQHAGLMVAGPVQALVARAYDDDEHVGLQRERYWSRLQLMSDALAACGVDAPLPDGAFYLWASKDGLDGWSLASWLAERAGVVVSPGEFYGEGRDKVRIAVVAADGDLERVAQRLRTL